MACAYLNTVPRPGDNAVVLLNKWLSAIGGEFGCGAQSEWFSLSLILTAYGGVPGPGDLISDLWRKIRIALGDTGCYCGDSAFDSARRILDILNPGSFRAGDSIYNILYKILQAVNATPIPVPVPTDFCCLLLESNGFDLELETNTNCLSLESCTA